MSYNKQNYARIRAEYEGKNLRAKQEAEARRRELHEKSGDIAAIDALITATTAGILDVSLKYFDRDERERRIGEIRAEVEGYRRERAQLVTSIGYPADYSDVKYECAICSDIGCLTDGRMCVCMKKKLAQAALESSGIGELAKTQSFADFDLSLYGSERENMRHTYDKLREYAESFKTKKLSEINSLLLIGATGLGKTHLSTAVALAAIDAACDVVYESAQNLFADFDAERFGRLPYDRPSPSRTLECDLLIIDDLGTENPSNFSVSNLYNIINTRLIKSLPTIINTNLSMDDLRRRYADRITSRIFGEYLPLKFSGNDIRAVKLRMGIK